MVGPRLLFGLAAVMVVASASSSCVPITFVLNVTAQNLQFSSPPDSNNQTAIVEFSKQSLQSGTSAPSNGSIDVSGTYTVHGIYCTPDANHGRDTLQVLVHGVSYNKTMWSGLGYGDQYSWSVFAASQGYHTLAIDRLGHGSTILTLDPIKMVQCPVQLETLHTLFQAIRHGGSSNALSRTFGKIVYVGHSLGSVFGTAVAAKYPDDIDAYVLTGYSAYPSVEAFVDTELDSVASVFPKRYAGVPQGYISFPSQANRTSLFYAGQFDPQVPIGDFLFEDTITAGELATFGTVLQPVTKYSGPVMALTGDGDALFCTAPGQTCEEILQSTAAVFPAVKNYSYYVAKDTGHDVTLHLTSQEAFKMAHNWLNQFFA